jgi:hypothetical protein
MTTTTNLADFGYRELKEAAKLLSLFCEKGSPFEYCNDGVTVMFNKNSGHVFLTNDEYEVAMADGDKLVLFYHCPDCGAEGFEEDISWNKHECRCGECAE